MRSMAAPNNSGDTKSPESEKSAPRSTAAFGAIRTLRVLLVGTIIVPLLLAGIGDLLTGVTDPQLRAQEKTLHEQIARQSEGLRQIAAAWVIGADGRELVSARVFPVNRDLDHPRREDFRTLRDA